VTTGQTYYIVSYTTNALNNTYLWGWHFPDIYPNGTTFIRYDEDDPYDETPGDMTFKTYGMESTELDIEFIKSGMALSVAFKNIGDYDAIDVVWNVNITGGIFGLINKHLDGEAEILATDDEILVRLTPIFGLGPLKVVATVSAANAEEVTEIWEGFIIFIFILGV
jgi:hypothetical protein